MTGGTSVPSRSTSSPSRCEQQALQAQSANLQGVSGASYTSAGFEQSLQSALTKLGFK
jgi:uncharacterized protein with FMN-binding domain